MSVEAGRLTKRERRIQRRTLDRKPTRESHKTRNIIIAAVPSGVLAAILAVAAVNSGKPTEAEAKTVSAPRPAATESLSDAEIIAIRVNSLQIAPSERERSQWERVSKEYFNSIPNDKEELELAAANALDATFQRMTVTKLDPTSGKPTGEGSENKYFNEAYQVYAKLLAAKELTYGPSSYGGPYSYLGTGVKVVEGKLKWMLSYNPKRLLEKGPETLAAGLAHEAKHITLGQQLRTENSTLSPDEFVKLYNERAANKEALIKEESIAYAQGEEAYILQKRIDGTVFVSPLETDAAALGRCDWDAQSSCWTTYIDNHLSSLHQ